MASSHAVPESSGELLTQPPFGEWSRLLERNLLAAGSWDFEVAGLSASEMRALAHDEALQRAEAFSARLGVPVRPVSGSAPIVATGHQPEFYHPGVWVKCFLLEQIATMSGANAIDFVVDSDRFEAVGASVPCMDPTVRRCTFELVTGGGETCFACSPVPEERDADRFCRSLSESLKTLAVPEMLAHFKRFCSALHLAVEDSDNLAETVTLARRRYEAVAGTGYLELPVTSLANSEAFARFVLHVSFEAAEFAKAYNAELDSYRAANGTRTKAQPFPDLRAVGDVVELPFWLLDEGQRHSVDARSADGGGVLLETAGRVIAELPGGFDDALDVYRRSGVVLVPKALALTTFTRMFACDLFIHGVGGGRYDRVTDGVIRRFFGVEPPGFVVASMTLHLPLEVDAVSEEEIALAADRLNRLTQNPDALLDDATFLSQEERASADDLVREKTLLVAAISEPGADRKVLGTRIRETNQELAALLEPLRPRFASELESLRERQAAAEVLTDRHYPFFLWDPREIAESLR